MDHIESSQSHQNRPIVKLDFKTAFNTVHRDHLLRVSSKRAPTIARLALIAYRFPSTALASGHSICTTTSIQQGDPHWHRSISNGSLRGVIITVIQNQHDAILSFPAESVFTDVRSCTTELKTLAMKLAHLNVKSSL